MKGHTYADCYARLDQNLSPEEKKKKTEERRKAKDTEYRSSNKGSPNEDKGKGKGQTLYCVWCKKEGHWRADCAEWAKVSQTKKDEFNKEYDEKKAKRKAAKEAKKQNQGDKKK
jgi:hypothetical protein